MSESTGQPSPVGQQLAMGHERQRDLFGDSWLKSNEAQAALNEFDLAGALALLAPIAQSCPDDEALQKLTATIKQLDGTLTGGVARSGSECVTLLSLDAQVPDFLRSAWHRRVARAVEQESQLAADRAVAGCHYLRAGELVAAEQTLRSTLAELPFHALARCHLADTLALQGRLPAARIEYRNALAQHPAEVDWAGLVDREVADLPAMAELDYGVQGDPLEWTAVVGVIEGIFMTPTAAPNRKPTPGDSPVSPGLQFYDWMVAELAATDNAVRLTARRQLKAISPTMLAKYLTRH